MHCPSSAAGRRDGLIDTRGGAGDRATHRLIGLVNSGEVTLAPIDRDEDSYGRKLRVVKVDGKSVGETLVEDGLARWYAGGRKPWC